LDAKRFTQSCYWLSAATPTGLQPEVVEFFSEEAGAKVMYENVTMDGHMYPGGELTVAGKAGLGLDSGKGKGSGPVEFVERLMGSPAGSRKVTGRGLNRPETIESIFYM
jgi:mannosyl-oligosaccharide alpha-1,2-mannosidase